MTQTLYRIDYRFNGKRHRWYMKESDEAQSIALFKRRTVDSVEIVNVRPVVLNKRQWSENAFRIG